MAQYRKLAGTPGSDGLNTCPTVIDDVGTEDAIAQGYVLTAEEARALNIPEGETAVRIPKELLIRAARKLMEEDG